MAAVLLALSAAPGAAAQQGRRAPADTAGAEADTARVPAAADTAPDVPQSYPSLAGGIDSVGVAEVHAWGREELLDSTALTVADFLLDHAPGLLLLRANVHFGPQQLADGLLGPGAVRVVVDGREVPVLESAQAGLARFALSRIDRLRVIRRAGEVVVEITTPSHAGGEAYSRIEGGAGSPGAQLIRGVFTNGAGRHFTVGAAVDHLNIGGQTAPGDRLDAWGKLSWMPFGNRSGLEILWHSDAMNRAVTRNEDFTRSDLLLHGRAEIADGVQLDVWGGRTSRDPGPALPGSADGDGSDGAPADTASASSLDVPHAEMGLTAARGPLALEANARVQDAAGLASLETDLRAAVRITGDLSAHASWHYGSWEPFAASHWSGGVTFRPDVLGGVVLRAGAAAGTRGLARPAGEADSLTFDALLGSAAVDLGPYRLSGRASRRTVERQLPFGGGFDRALAPGPESTVVGLEGSARGPVVPVDVLEDRLRFEGFWRRSTAQSGALPVYVPSDVARGTVRFGDTFFDGNLEIRAAVRLLYRGAMRTAEPGVAEPRRLPARNTVNTSVVVRIDTFRLWWRVDNAQRLRQRDFVGLPFPTSRNVFGVKWEFFD